MSKIVSFQPIFNIKNTNEIFHILFSKPLKFDMYLTLSTPQLGLITAKCSRASWLVATVQDNADPGPFEVFVLRLNSFGRFFFSYTKTKY